jgi:hypothetical protein
VQALGADPRRAQRGLDDRALSDWRGATAAIRPSAPSGPMVVLSIAAPLSISVISEITPSCGK